MTMEFDATVKITTQGITIKPKNQTIFSVLYPDGKRSRVHVPKPGDAGFQSVLTEEQAEEIIRDAHAAVRKGDRSRRQIDHDISLGYDVGPGTIRAIRTGNRWKDVYARVMSELEEAAGTEEDRTVLNLDTEAEMLI